jgi:hypothetical protein
MTSTSAFRSEDVGAEFGAELSAEFGVEFGVGAPCGFDPDAPQAVRKPAGNTRASRTKSRRGTEITRPRLSERAPFGLDALDWLPKCSAPLHEAVR